MKNSQIQTVYEDMLNRIVNLMLLPGEKISENKIGEYYNVSRTIARGAFYKLQQMNFLEIKPQSGTFVTKIDFNYIKSAMVLRLALEKELLERILKDPKEKEVLVEKLKKSLEQQKTCGYGREDMRRFIQYDNEFHDAIYSGHKGMKTRELIYEHLMHFARWRTLVMRGDMSPEKIIDEHEEIIRCARTGDVENMRNIMDVHINKTIYSVFPSNKDFDRYFK